MINIIILGANGFIGKNLVEIFLQNKSVKVFAFHRKNINIWTESSQLTELKYNNQSIEQIQKNIAGQSSTILINTVYDSKLICTNKAMIDLIYKISAKIKLDLVIHLSSIAVYDGYSEVLMPQDKKSINPNPQSFYGRIKMLSEKYLEKKRISQLLVLRLPNILGKNSSWNTFFESVKYAQEIHLPNGGESFSPFINVNVLCSKINELIRTQNFGQLPLIVDFFESKDMIKWKDIITENNPAIIIKHTNKNIFSDSKLKDVFFKMLSLPIVTAILFHTKITSKIFSLLFQKNNNASNKPAIIHVDNTARLIQKVDVKFY
jgi:dTDP-4-dehydrorhamnose reductase